MSQRTSSGQSGRAGPYQLGVNAAPGGTFLWWATSNEPDYPNAGGAAATRQEAWRLAREAARIEPVAHRLHEAWMTWAATLLKEEPGLSEGRRQRWQAMLVPYAELSEEAKEKDREWARTITR